MKPKLCRRVGAFSPTPDLTTLAIITLRGIRAAVVILVILLALAPHTADFAPVWWSVAP